jgi:hypothetical protein
MKQSIRILFIISFCFQALSLMAQDTIVIEQSKVIAKGQNFEVAAGTTLVLKPGAKIWVEGSLNFAGTSSNPIVVISQDAANPGAGIVINGQSYNQSIQIAHTKFISLSQALRFDPFWARKSVSLNNIQVSQSVYNESSIYVSSPFIDYNYPPIEFSLTELDYFNNNAAIFIEELGNKSIHFTLKGLNFFENEIAESAEKTGILHLQITEDKNKHRNIIDKVSFNRNFQGTKEIGISVSGNQDTIHIESAQSKNANMPLIDASSDPRLPYVSIAKNDDIKNSLNDKCLLQSIAHQKGQIVLKGAAACAVSQLIDSNLQPVSYTISRAKDSITMLYSGNTVPTKLNLNNQIWVKVPALLVTDSIHTSQAKKEENRTHGFWADSSMLKELDFFTKSYEVGMFTGIATYVGDIKPKFGLPACYEFSNGMYLQYHHSKHLSYQITFNRADLGSDDPTSLFLAYSSMPIYIDKGSVAWKVPSYRMNFKTKLYAFEIGTTYYFERYNKGDKSVENLKGKWVNGIGIGIGIFKFDPYRYAFYSKNSDEIQWVSLREMGTEGQNFLPGKTPYGKYAFNFNLHYQLNFCYERWKFKTEIRGVITSTNYLDDFADGYYYGNNYEKWASTIPQWGNYVDQNGNSVSLVQVFPDYGKVQSKKTYSMLPDGYLQFHLGISYDLGNPFKSKK